MYLDNSKSSQDCEHHGHNASARFSEPEYLLCEIAFVQLLTNCEDVGGSDSVRGRSRSFLIGQPERISKNVSVEMNFGE